MNGRVYDPAIGRFLSADPFVQFPDSTQGLNRYTYVGNNPLSYTDPSGFFSLKKFLGKALGFIAPYLSFIPGCQVWCSALAGAVSGYLLTGSFEGAMYGAAGATIGAITMNGGNLFGFNAATRFTIGALGTATLTAAAGGKFGDGLLNGMLGSVAATLSQGNPIAAAILGGLVSDIGGGKFANGAKSAFFHALFGPRLKSMFSGSAVTATNNGQQTAEQQVQQRELAVNAANTAPVSGFWNNVTSLIGKVWTLPNTIIGLIYGGIGYVAGLIMGTNPTIRIGNNAIEFLNNPLVNRSMALTLGNVVSYGTNAPPWKQGAYGDISVNIGMHETGHTYQYEILGPFYGLFYMLYGGFSGPTGNQFERSAQNYGSGNGSWWP